MEIRPARAADIDLIDAIERASFTADRFPRRNLARMLRSPSAELVLATSKGAPVGYVLVLFRKGAKAARLYSLAVAPAARGKGGAAKLVQAAAQCAIERDCDRLRLEVRASNEAAISLYRREGFRTTKETPGYYNDGESAIHMELRLDPHKERIK